MPSNDRLDSGCTLRGKNYDRSALSRLFSVRSYDLEAQNELGSRGGRFGGGEEVGRWHKAFQRRASGNPLAVDRSPSSKVTTAPKKGKETKKQESV